MNEEPTVEGEKKSNYIQISKELAGDLTVHNNAAYPRMMAMLWNNILNPPSPEEVERREREAAERRAEERARYDRVPFDFTALLDKMGWSREYAEHLVQPYCYCDCGWDGWETCRHAYDEGVV